MEQQAQKTILDDHRNMLMVSKKISEFQEINLKTWGLIVFDDVDSVKIDYNFIKKDQFYPGNVCFDFKFKNGKIPTGEKKNKGITSLYTWTCLLFWTDTKVTFKVNGKKWT